MKLILGYRKRLGQELRLIIRNESAATNPDIEWGADFFGRLETFAVSGKLFRGSLACFAYQTLSGHEPNESVIKAAAALELAHSALLIHDDIMDNDQLRRGRPSIHRQYELIGDKRQIDDPVRFGNSLAVCGGDTALLLAFRLLSEVQTENMLGLPGKLFSNLLIEVCSGQMQDVYFDANSKLPTKQAIFNLMRSKTATYTVVLPLIMGAALADQSQLTISRLRKFGEAAGVIYQIRDDQIGLCGDQAIIGKPVGSDIRQHKKTLIYYYLNKHANSIDRQTLNSIYSKTDVDANEINNIQNLLNKYRVEDKINKDILKLRGIAITQIDKLNVNEPAKSEFYELLDYCARRSR